MTSLNRLYSKLIILVEHDIYIKDGKYYVKIRAYCNVID